MGVKFTLYLLYGAFLGLRGNELAWRAKRWRSLAHFKQVQQQWMLVALVVNLVLLFVIPIVTRG
jgi:H+/Cl- antiporter ClcA